MQGFDGKPDFPTIDIYVPDDHREMETSDQDWWVERKLRTKTPQTFTVVIQTHK